MRYLSLLGDPEQNRITRASWRVATTEDELVWAQWQPESVVAVENEPPAGWYEDSATRNPTTVFGDVEATLAAMRSGGKLDKTALIADAPTAEAEAVTPPPGIGGDGLKNLAALDELHREEALGRIGWLFLAGTIRLGTQDIACCFPLFERRSRFVRVNGIFYPQWSGALYRSSVLQRRQPDNVADPVDDFLRDLDDLSPAMVAVKATEMLRHFDITVTSIAEPTINPVSIDPTSGTVLVPGTGFYLAQPRAAGLSQHNDLTRWTSRDLGPTAFAELYRTSDASSSADAGHQSAEIRCSLPLNQRQRAAIQRVAGEAVVAVSGPPGTGKTHMIVAAATNAVAQGMSVLIATKSDFAAESTCELLDIYPTPRHVRFGQEQHRREVADLLSSGSAAGISDENLGKLEDAEAAAWAAQNSKRDQVVETLIREQAFERAQTQERHAASGAQRMLEVGFDMADLDRLRSRASSRTGLGQKRALSQLRKKIGASSNASLEMMNASIAGAQAELAIRDALDRAQGSALDDLWKELDRSNVDAQATQAVTDIARRSRPTPEAMASTAALATALRASLTSGQLDLPIETTTAFLYHLPFWVGTLDEIEQTLPTNPAMFDLVIFDEASQIDQLSAIPALCRAKRAMVVGDPKQLRHTPTITTEQIEAARLHIGLRPGPEAAILDVAENSLFDVAASATPVTWLDEHFRSVPHLIQFASERWYDNNLRLMTRHPSNEGLDVIHTHRVLAQRTSKINEQEIEAVLARVRQLQDRAREDRETDRPPRSVGVITPFVEQAEAIEQALATEFDYDTIREMKLRVGTVRGVQGTERDTVLVSLVIDERDFGRPLQMVEDPHLFNVMTTRARSQLEMFHSFDESKLPGGILADWFHYEKHPPGLSSQLAPINAGWTQRLAEALELGGVRVVTGYPIAGWSIDLVVGEGRAALGVETTVHPEGPTAHMERHLTLRRAGWDLVSMFESSWLLQTEEAAVHLASIAARRAAT